MAQTIEYNIKVNDSGASRTLTDIENELHEINQELKDVDVNSDVFAKGAKAAQKLERELENANLALKGLTDEDKIRGFQGAIDVVGGSVAGLTGAVGLLGLENEEFEKYTAYAANAIAFSEGIRTAAQGLVDLRSAIKAAGGAQKVFNVILTANPIGLIVAGIAALTAGFVELVHRMEPAVSRMETLKNMFLSLGNPAKFATLQSLSLANALEELARVDIEEGLKDTIAVMQAFGEDTVEFELQLAEKKVAAMKEGEEGYRDAMREVLVLRAKRAQQLGEEEATAQQEAFNKKLAELQLKWTLEEESRAIWEQYGEESGDEMAEAFNAAFKKKLEETPFDPNDIEWIDEMDLDIEEDLDTLFKGYGKLKKEELDALKLQRENLDEFRENAQAKIDITRGIIDAVEVLRQSEFDREMARLGRERDEVLANNSITQEAKEKQIEEIEKKEKAAQIRKIKQERDAFTIKQALYAAEITLDTITNTAKQVNSAATTATEATAAGTRIGIAGAEATAKASMSIGSFMAALGPFGIAAFAVAIGGVIASIIAARRSAKSQIAALGDTSGAGASIATPSLPAPSAIEAPRDTGTNPENMAACQTVRAYVVGGDVTSEQEATAKLNARRTLG